MAILKAALTSEVGGAGSVPVERAELRAVNDRRTTWPPAVRFPDAIFSHDASNWFALAHFALNDSDPPFSKLSCPFTSKFVVLG